MLELSRGLKRGGLDNGCHEYLGQFSLSIEASLSTALVHDQFHDSVSTGEEQNNILCDL